jgi:hypothetical protein
MKKIIIVLGLIVSLLVALPRLVSQTEEPDKKKVEVLMKRKLEQAQQLLDGVATGNFDKIVKHAAALNDLSKEAAWRAVKTPRYEMYSSDFQKITETLMKSGKEKNLDAAALAYLDLTLTCVKCHKHVREVRMVRADME